ncbi:MAG: PEGA domain-containing protein [Planctomycetota bacterium]|nr:MAG: PEGA domain-containing protein [Planctomycetota bacterium]
MKRKIYFLAFLCFLTIFSGCATIFTGTEQSIQVNSEPNGAEVRDNGIPVGKTPCSIRVTRGFGHEILLVKEGYRNQAVDLRAKLNPIIFLNILNLGIGFAVDFLTGAYQERYPKEIFARLRPDNPQEKQKTEEKPDEIPDPFVPK